MRYPSENQSILQSPLTINHMSLYLPFTWISNKLLKSFNLLIWIHSFIHACYAHVNQRTDVDSKMVYKDVDAQSVILPFHLVLHYFPRVVLCACFVERISKFENQQQQQPLKIVMVSNQIKLHKYLQTNVNVIYSNLQN